MPTLKTFLILGSMHLCFSELHKRRIKCPVVAVSKHLTEISLQIWGEIQGVRIQDNHPLTHAKS